jgi:pimeloyl-ACP methyl ester carboxylesterase
VAELAARQPGLVSRLVLEDPPWKEDRDESLAILQQRREGAHAYLNSLATMTDREIRELGRNQHPDWHDLDIADWVISKRQVRVEAAGDLDFSGWSAVIDRIDCPTLLIHGDANRGGIVTPALAERLALSNARITACLVEDSGHNIRRENFPRYAEVLGEFLTSS